MELHQEGDPTRWGRHGSGCATCSTVGGGLCARVQDLWRGPVPELRRHDRVLQAGDDLLRPGDPLDETVSCLSGWLYAYYLLEDGRRQILAFHLPGDVLTTLGERRAAPYGIQALTDSRICGVPNAWLDAWLETRPREARRLLAATHRQETRSCGLVTSLGRRNAKERVAYLLLELALRSRVWRRDYDATEVPLTQAVIADTLGLTPVHVNRTLAHLRQSGAVGYCNRRLHVLSLERLRQEANAEEDALLAWLGTPDKDTGPRRRLTQVNAAPPSAGLS